MEKKIEDPEKQIETRLLALGVAKARETIQESLLNGTTLETMISIIEYFSSRPGAWGPGALRRRLTLGSAQPMATVHGQALASAQGWPPASSRENQLRTRKAVASDREKRSTEAKASEDRKSKECQLEFQFGPILDAMPTDELYRLVTEKKPFLMQKLLQYGATSNLVRGSLLGLMASVSGPNQARG